MFDTDHVNIESCCVDKLGLEVGVRLKFSLKPLRHRLLKDSAPISIRTLTLSHHLRLNQSVRHGHLELTSSS